MAAKLGTPALETHCADAHIKGLAAIAIAVPILAWTARGSQANLSDLIIQHSADDITAGRPTPATAPASPVPAATRG